MALRWSASVTSARCSSGFSQKSAIIRVATDALADTTAVQTQAALSLPIILRARQTKADTLADEAYQKSSEYIQAKQENNNSFSQDFLLLILIFLLRYFKCQVRFSFSIMRWRTYLKTRIVRIETK